MTGPDRTLVGPYEIVAPLGAGGMGEVYRAWDPRLQREVAVKILPEDLARDPERRRRFLDEARAAGALNHPNILAVYDVGVGDGTPYIVTELIEGRELRDEIDRGPIATRRLLELGSQIAAGLATAHAAGIAHRDLKPENVIVTRDSRVKILDFGLAKAFALAARDAAGPTQATVTLPGTVVGTPQYMSPEQARGADVDFRSDQFSLGVLLYEMVTGRHPFRRETTVQTMSAILADEPVPIAELSPRTPAAVRWIVERCLAKEPAERYAATDDLAKDLDVLLMRLGELSAVGTTAVAGARRRWMPAAVVAAALALVLAVAGALASSSEPSRVVDYRPLVTEGRFQGAPAWSPDGNTIAYASSVDGVLQVFTKSLASPFPQQQTHSSFDCTDPFWSRDGTRIYYHSQALDSVGLWSITLAGGEPESILVNAVGGTASRDTVAFFREQDIDLAYGARQTLWLSGPMGENPRRYMGAPFDVRTFVAGTLRFSPDGSKLLAWVWGWEGNGSTVPAPEFWIIPFPTGQPRRVLSTLARATPAAASFDWLPDGRRIVVSIWDAETTGMHLWIADVDGNTSTLLTSTAGSENRPAVAPDGRSVAFADEEVDFDLVEIPLDGSPLRKRLETSRNELDPVFAPDGSRYAYVSDRGGVLQIWVRSRDGQFDQPLVGTAQTASDPTLTLGSLAFSPRGDRLAYQRYGGASGYQIWISAVTAAGPPVPLGGGSFFQDAPTWSPLDGSEVAFLGRTPTSVSGLMRQRVGSSAPAEMVLPETILLSRAAWSPDGRWIACQTSDGLVLVSPDGRNTRLVSQDAWIEIVWDADGRRLYGLREGAIPRHFGLFVIDIGAAEGARERVINPDLGVIPHAQQPIRGLSFADPATLVTSIASARSDIWLLEGLEPAPSAWWRRLWPLSIGR